MLDRDGDDDELDPAYTAYVGMGQNIEFERAKPKYIQNIGDWTTAFHVFMYLYLQANPTSALEMLRYCEVIRFAACQGVGGS